MEEKNLNEIVVFEENNIVNEKNLNELLVNMKNIKNNLESFEKDLKEKLINVMIKNGETSYKLDNFTVSLVVGKDEEVFDKDEFINKTSDDVVTLFTRFEETEEFDLEEFKKENPEMYKKYTKSNINFEVDTKKLKDNFPEIYKKFVTIVPSTRKTTISIKDKK